MKLYLYDSHLGGLYLSKREKTLEECYWDYCGDYDIFICEITKTTTVFEVLCKLEEHCLTSLSEEIIEKLLKE